MNFADFNPIIALVYYAVFLFSTTLHEAAHATAALLGGDETAYEGGQVSLDPLPHIQREPFGMLVLPILALFIIQWPFGYASTPYDPQWADRHPRRAALMALAGPAANLLLMIVFGLAIRFVVASPSFEIAGLGERGFDKIVVSNVSNTMSGIAMLLSVGYSLNLLLFLLNLLPVPPLDGSAALGLLLPEKQARVVHDYLRQPMFSLVGILLAWRVVAFLFGPAWFAGLRILLG
jgi:Zn-dependent protease